MVEETRVVRHLGRDPLSQRARASDTMGRQIASYVTANSIRPVR
jgi:hypothetical protein